jgi:hypothetical protein
VFPVRHEYRLRMKIKLSSYLSVWGMGYGVWGMDKVSMLCRRYVYLCAVLSQ